MKANLEKLAPFNPAGNVNVIIETPKGSHFKYVYTPESGLFRIKRVLPPGMVFPFN
jgi:inorganic pyrophosphatase